MQFMVRLMARLAARLGVNALPVVAIAKLDWPPMSAMILYALENLIAVLFAVLIVRLLAPARGESGGTVRERGELLKTFLIVAGSFGVLPLAFVAFMMVKTGTYPGGAFLPMASAMFAFQLLGFVATYRDARGAPFAAFESHLEKSLGRVFLLFAAIGVGVGIALFFGAGVFVYPFVLLKTVVDLWSIPTAMKQRGLAVPA